MNIQRPKEKKVDDGGIREGERDRIVIGVNPSKSYE
jgi:hypothetical protein